MKLSRAEIEEITKETCKAYNIPVNFLLALIQTESNFNQYVVRYERGYLWTYSPRECAEMLGDGCTKDTMEMMQKTSWGLTQLMAANLYASLNFKGWPGELLHNVKLSLDLTAQYINNMMRRQEIYWTNPLDVYAAYNAGSVRHTAEGIYVNARNVNRFNKIYKLYH